ncbi:MAG: hypothetical protein ACREV9_11405 [Burkholderiales bacterium]
MSSSTFVIRFAKRLIVSCLIFGAAGCAQVMLDGVVKRDRLVSASEGVEISRQGRPIAAGDDLALEPGDRIRTDSESTAIIRYASGTVVYVRPNSIVRIGSIFVEIGEIFVRVRGFFEVDTEFVKAGTEGTEYVVRVRPGNNVDVVVLESKVACVSKTQRWPRFLLAPGEKANFDKESPPSSTRATPAELKEIRRWVAEIERAASPPAHLGGCCARGKAFTADRLRCALNRGVYYETVEEARRSCAAPVPSGWCCVGGEVTQSTGENCARREGRFYDDLNQAKRNCQPPQTSGWCCTSIVLGRERQFNLSESTEQSCAAARGQYYRSYAEAKNRCQPPPEPIGYCCVDYKISELTRKQCNERNGSFSNDRAALEKQCRKPYLDPGIRERIYTPAPEPVIR